MLIKVGLLINNSQAHRVPPAKVVVASVAVVAAEISLDNRIIPRRARGRRVPRGRRKDDPINNGRGPTVPAIETSTAKRGARYGSRLGIDFQVPGLPPAVHTAPGVMLPSVSTRSPVAHVPEPGTTPSNSTRLSMRRLAL